MRLFKTDALRFGQMDVLGRCERRHVAPVVDHDFESVAPLVVVVPPSFCQTATERLVVRERLRGNLRTVSVEYLMVLKELVPDVMVVVLAVAVGVVASVPKS
jgi:hypothetical protein